MHKIILGASAATLVLLSLAAAGPAAAAKCQTKYLTGTWVGQPQVGGDYCIVEFNQRGWIVQASCFDPASLKSGATFDGRFTATPSCSVAGNYDVIPKRGPTQTTRFTGTLDPKTGVMRGRVEQGAAPRVRYLFRQQW